MTTRRFEWHRWIDGAPPAPVEQVPLTAVLSTSSQGQPVNPAGLVVGDLVVVFAMIDAALPAPTTLNGFELVGWSDSVTHAAYSHPWTYRLGIWSRRKVSASNPLPVLPNSGGNGTSVVGVVAFRGPGEVTGASFATVADAKSAATPGRDPADVRVWGTVANKQTITPPAGQTVRCDNGGYDIDLLVTTGAETGPVAASVDTTAGWCMATLSVGLGGPLPTMQPVQLDEFAAGALDPAWTRRNRTAANESWNAAGMSVSLAAGQGYLRPVPTGTDWTIDLDLDYSPATAPPGGVMVGPWMLDDTGAGITASWYTNPQGLLTLNTTGYAYASGYQQLGVVPPAQPTTRIRFRKEGTSYFVSYSSDGGATYSAESTAHTRGQTITKVGFGSIYGTATVRVTRYALSQLLAPPPDPDPDPEPDPEPVAGWQLVEDRSKALYGFTATHGGPESSVSLQLVAGLAPLAPELGERFRITLTAATIDALGIDEADAPRFTGEVTDCVSDTTWHQVVGIGRWAKHGRTMLDGAGYPVEDDGARIARILGATRSAGDVGTIDPGTTELLPQPGTQPAAAHIAAVAASTGGRLVEQRDGAMDWHDSEHRRGTPVLLELTAAEVFGPGFTWAKRVGDLVNDATVKYGGTGAASVRVVDGASDDTRGSYPQEYDTLLVDQSAAYDLAASIVSRLAEPVWQLPAVQVDLARTVLDPARVAIAATLRHGDRVAITGLPPSPDAAQVTALHLFVEQTIEQAWRSPGTHDTPARDNWRLTLAVTDPRQSGTSLRWIDLPVGLSWDELAPGLSWLDLGRIESPTDPALTTP